jgi:hypothetical protein
MTITLVHNADACPVSLAGGVVRLSTGDSVYCRAWHAWWLAKLWRGEVLPGHGWPLAVIRAELEADYLAWARQHSEQALYTVPIEQALYWPTRFALTDWSRPELVLEPLPDMRHRWDNTLFPVRWPEPEPAARRSTPRRPLAPAFALPIAA